MRRSAEILDAGLLLKSIAQTPEPGLSLVRVVNRGKRARLCACPARCGVVRSVAASLVGKLVGAVGCLALMSEASLLGFFSGDAVRFHVVVYGDVRLLRHGSRINEAPPKAGLRLSGSSW